MCACVFQLPRLRGNAGTQGSTCGQLKLSTESRPVCACVFQLARLAETQRRNVLPVTRFSHWTTLVVDNRYDHLALDYECGVNAEEPLEMKVKKELSEL